VLSSLPSAVRFLQAEEGGGDEEVFARKMAWAQSKDLQKLPLGTIVAEVSMSFLGTPYVAHSLEVPGDEHLVVNLRAFDCVTFVESTLAMSRCIRTKKTRFADFMSQLQTLRYRGGVIRGYPSRLHYFIDWIGDNERKGLVRDITGDLGGEQVHKTLCIMSTHRSSYPQLERVPDYRAILAAERRLSAKPYRVIPRQHVAAAEPRILSGDIIALATSISGVDVTHTGLSVVSEGTVRYLHAPLSGGAVTVSEGSLSHYVGKGSRTLTGIVVARPLEP
jgi:hypothetical protein